MPVLGQGAPQMREHFAWEGVRTHRRNRDRFVRTVLDYMRGPNDPKIEFDQGALVIVETGHRVFRGVVLVDVLDVDNANLNGWFVQSRATTKQEKQAGLVRVCKA